MFLILAPLALAGSPLDVEGATSPLDADTGGLDTAFERPEALGVTGGEIVTDDRWDGTAAIVFNGSEVGCTGVLVAPDVVLTAGHCVGGITHVIIGANNYERDEGETLPVRRETTYPQWWSTYDIALLKLSQPSTYPPRVIAQDCILEPDTLYDGAEVVVTGWGAHDTWGNAYDARLRAGFITVDDHDCTDFRSGCVREISPGGELGAGIAVDGVDSCYGDSGGPLYLTTDRGDFVVGIVSRGYDTVTVPCGEGGIYVRPDAVLDWIEEQGQVTLERPDCSPPNAAPEPTAPTLTVPRNGSNSLRVAPNDPDLGQTHSLELLTAPQHGEVTLGAGLEVTYTADKGYIGEDSFELRVFDDAESPLSADLVVEVVVERRCGCASGPSQPASLAPLALLLGLISRRRRSLKSV